MTLVELRCQKCRKLLGELVSAPAEGDELRWSGGATVPRCPRHGGAHGSVARWVEARRRLGRPYDRYPARQWVRLAELREAVARARREGHAQTHLL